MSVCLRSLRIAALATHCCARYVCLRSLRIALLLMKRAFYSAHARDDGCIEVRGLHTHATMDVLK
jgi:hypothetical protein